MYSIAFEPIPETADILCDQVQINRLEKIVSIGNKGVGDKEGTLSFTNGRGAMNRVSLADEGENIERVKVVTLDAELTQDTKYFLKIDVEGYEYNVIEGASKLLSSDNISVIIIELNGSGSEFGRSNDDVHNKILSHGFSSIAYDPISRGIKRLDDEKIKIDWKLSKKDLVLSDKDKNHPPLARAKDLFD